MKQTPSQTVGPFFNDGLIQKARGLTPVVAREGARGQRIVLTGRVFDGDGNPVPDAMIEIWQADAAGVHAHPADPRHAEADPAFAGFGRSDTVNGGRYAFHTVKPGSVQGQAPHISLRVFSRGMLIHAHTRAYFEDEAANAGDALLKTVPAKRRTTLIARRDTQAAMPTYVLDIHLQGRNETVFFTA